MSTNPADNSEYDEELMQRCSEELKQLPESMLVSMAPLDALAIIGSLQLALRHPMYIGPSRANVIHFVNAIQEWFSKNGNPAIVEIINKGWQTDQNTG